MQRYDDMFNRLKSQQQGAFVPFVTIGDPSLELSFDIIKTLIDSGADALELVGLELNRYDRDGRFAGQQRLDRNGDSTTMSILTVPNRSLPANGSLVVFNPFTRFASDDWLGALKVEAVFVVGKDGTSYVAIKPPGDIVTDNLAREYFGEQAMLGYVKNVQREEIRQGIACVKHQNMSGSDIGDDHKEYFAGEAALKAGGAHNTMNQFEAA